MTILTPEPDLGPIPAIGDYATELKSLAGTAWTLAAALKSEVEDPVSQPGLPPRSLLCSRSGLTRLPASSSGCEPRGAPDGQARPGRERARHHPRDGAASARRAGRARPHPARPTAPRLCTDHAP